MQDNIDDIKKRIEALEILIRETKARLPAHCFLTMKMNMRHYRKNSIN